MEKNKSRSTLSVIDAVCLLIGVVVGVGIFKTPSIVAAHAETSWGFLLLWIFGGVISLMGALCYAELGSANPNAGGEYHFLKRAYGKTTGFFFAWGRLGVIQTGAIAAVAFVLGDYLTALYSLGPSSSAIYAGIAVILLTALNVRGVQQSKWTQNGLTLITIGIMSILILTGVFVPSASEALPVVSESSTSFGFAMIFVLLTFGGWNEAVYLSGEVRNVQKNMSRILIIGTLVIGLLYLLINFAYLRTLGLDGMSGSDAVAADMMQAAFGVSGAQFVSLIIAGATLTTLNATIFTGARGASALGRDFEVLRWLGKWDEKADVPVNSLLLQGGISLFLIFIGAFYRQGFTMMVEYTAPVFWLFFLLSALSLFVLRRKEPHLHRPFKVPLYPYIPAVFCLVCIYMLYSSLMHTGVGALMGIGVLALGIPVYYFATASSGIKKASDSFELQ